MSFSLERVVQKRFPKLYVRSFGRWRAWNEHPTERKELRGERTSAGQHSSVCVFTTHKCASVYVERLLCRLAEAFGSTYVNYDRYFTLFDPKLYRHYRSEVSYTRAFHPQGYCYGPFRGINELAEDARYKRIVNLRDPRDVVVSSYFSTAFSHSVNIGVLEHRDKVRAMDINDFARQEAAQWKQVYGDYEALLQEHGESVLLVRYEDFILRFEHWLTQLFEFLSIPLRHPLFGQLVAESEEARRQREARKGEDKYQHIRKATPGDFREKLSPETIAWLNDEFAAILQFLDTD